MRAIGGVVFLVSWGNYEGLDYCLPKIRYQNVSRREAVSRFMRITRGDQFEIASDAITEKWGGDNPVELAFWGGEVAMAIGDNKVANIWLLQCGPLFVRWMHSKEKRCSYWNRDIDCWDNKLVAIERFLEIIPPSTWPGFGPYGKR